MSGPGHAIPLHGRTRPRGESVSRATDSAADQRIWTPAGGGRPLDEDLRRTMEERFRADFSAVRIHDDPAAGAAAKALSAKAYTFGKDIYFGESRFSPGTTEGRKLIAHELAHVVQQGRGGTPPALDPGSGLEQSAHAAAQAVVAGSGPVSVQGSSGIGVAREKDDEEDEVADMSTLMQLRKQRGSGGGGDKPDNTVRIDNWETKGKGTLAETTVPFGLYSGWDWNHIGGGFETSSSRTSLARQTPYSKDPSAGIDFIVENTKTGRLVIGEQKAVDKRSFEKATATTVNLETNLDHAVRTLEAKLKSGEVHPDQVDGLKSTIGRLKATQQALKNQTDLPEGVVFELTNLGGKGEKIGKNHIDNLKKYEKNPAFLEHLLSRTFVRDPALAKRLGHDSAGQRGTDADPDIVPAKDILTPDAKDSLERIRQGKTEKEWKKQKDDEKAEKKRQEEAEKKKRQEEKAAAAKAKADKKAAEKKQKAAARKKAAVEKKAEKKRLAAEEKKRARKEKSAKGGKAKPAADAGEKAPAPQSKTAAGDPPETAKKPASKPKKADGGKKGADPAAPAPETTQPAKKSSPKPKAPKLKTPKKAGSGDTGGAEAGTPAKGEPKPKSAKSPETPAKGSRSGTDPAPAGGEHGPPKKPSTSPHAEGPGKGPGAKIDAAAGKIGQAGNEAAALIRAYDKFEEERKEKGDLAATASAVKTYFDNTNLVMGAIANADEKQKKNQDFGEAWLSTIGETGAGFLVPGKGVDQAINGVSNLLGAVDDHTSKGDPDSDQAKGKANYRTAGDFIASLTPSKMFSQTIGAGARSYYLLAKSSFTGDQKGFDRFGDDAAKGELGMIFQPFGMAADFVGNLGFGEGASRALDRTLDKTKGSTLEKVGSWSGDAFYELGQSKEAKSGKYGPIVQGWAALSSIGTDMILDKPLDQAIDNAIEPGSGGLVETVGSAMGDATYHAVEKTKQIVNEDLPKAKAAIKEKATELKAEATQTISDVRQTASETLAQVSEAASEYKDMAAEKFDTVAGKAREYKAAAGERLSDAKKRLASVFDW